MVNALVFFAHFIFGLVIFSKKWQDENLSTAALNLALIGIIFSVGWSIATMIAKVVMEPKGLGVFYDQDTFSLTLVSIAEYFFYKIYYKDIFATEAGTEK
jgi:hypothetical protein